MCISYSEHMLLVLSGSGGGRSHQTPPNNLESRSARRTEDSEFVCLQVRISFNCG